MSVVTHKLSLEFPGNELAQRALLARAVQPAPANQPPKVLWGVLDKVSLYLQISLCKVRMTAGRMAFKELLRVLLNRTEGKKAQFHNYFRLPMEIKEQS